MGRGGLPVRILDCVRYRLKRGKDAIDPVPGIENGARSVDLRPRNVTVGKGWRLFLGMAYLLAACCLSLAWICQLYVVFPFEQMLRGDGSAVTAFSYMFLPHGAKVIIALILMKGALPVIFLVTLCFGMLSGGSPDYALFGSLIAAITALLPIWLINLTFRQPLNQRIWSFTQNNFSMFRFAFAISLAVALLNSIFQAALAKAKLNVDPDFSLAIGFLIGDIVGGVICIMVIILSARYLLVRVRNVL